MFRFCVFVTMAQCCIHTTEVHVTTLSWATAAAVAFGTVAFNSSVMGGGGFCVGSEMDLQAVLSPTDVCPSFAIRPGDAWSVCWGFGWRAVHYSLACHSWCSYYFCLSHCVYDLLSWISCCLCAFGLESGDPHGHTEPPSLQSHLSGSESQHHPSFSLLSPLLVHLDCAAYIW